ncbi:hypothetical protein [Streptomyces sp. NBC_00091]|uniref:hypothetical protein n=1 Tax=Streptomyces sp. NBC_00091 TaxID=2975648 RepID=UPI00224D2FEA|nr:hypothetical protein [Streptomyces sp. NBC_00091]MCX5377340.1 hypothetical protein [Streptomyces sp. NBC_00091]
MNGARYGRTVLTRALTVVCVALLCLFGAGPAATASAGAESRPASSAPADPAEGQSEPSGDPMGRAAVRAVERGAPAVRGLPPRMFHVKHTGGPTRVASYGTAEPDLSRRTVRGVVLRC